MALKTKTPAEFFAEHQNIAGFDNAGKSLYTTIREFVENSLDAAEAINVLPDVSVTVEKLTSAEFHKLRGTKARERGDLSLYQDFEDEKKKGKKRKKDDDPGKEKILKKKKDEEGATETSEIDDKLIKKEGKKKKEDEKEGKNYGYFRVSCKDNGVGMPHEKIPRMLGIVLSSTKYGVKQTRGKFGLGAKMALVWSKKSTGLPIEVWSATSEEDDISYCKLDIDIYKNQPKVIIHEKQSNSSKWRGTEIKIVIGGNWSSYQPKVINYMRQLAVITPYAHLDLRYTDPDSTRKSFALQFRRRSDLMPPLAQEVKHHPSSVDNLLVEQLIHSTKAPTLQKFLSTEFTSIKPSLATKLIAELGDGFDPKMDPKLLKKKEIHQLTQLLKEAKFAKPSSDCLSPAGEYNLRLGIIKEINPEMVATFSEPAAVHEGHPFLVEAAVSLGGSKTKSGITVFRFANRIPLLFESGNDVVSQVANKGIRWGAYKVKNTDKIGVFVSIVSTKIPFKGTSKEYIGDDKGVMNAAIKHALMQCCAQLKKQIMKKIDLKSRAERKKTLERYIPDVCNAIHDVLNKMLPGDPRSDSKDNGAICVGPAPKNKALAESVESALRETSKKILGDVKDGSLTLAQLQKKLTIHVEQIDSALALEAAMSTGRQMEEDKCYILPVNDDLFRTQIYGGSIKLSLL